MAATRNPRFRSATPAETGAAHERNTVPPARTSLEIATQRATLIAEAEQLQARTRSATAPLTADEETKLDSLITQAESLDGDLKNARRDERIAAQRNSLNQPSRPAPAPPSATVPAQARSRDDSELESMRLWLNSFTADGDRGPDASYRAQQGGFSIGQNSARIPCDYNGTLNRMKRRALSKGGVGAGKELIPNTYSGKVTEYLSYFSPLLTLVDSETTNDGNDRDYFVIDDTSLVSNYITASAGTELNPTIPDNDLTTASKRIKCQDITSGYHKITQQALRDSAITLTDKVTKAIGNSHARCMERDVILGTGVNQPEGLITSSNIFGAAVADLTPDVIEDMYFSIPIQYRSGCIWLMSDSAMARAKKKLKDTVGRTLFDKTLEDGAEVYTLHGRPVYVSNYMPAYGANAKPILFFNPMFYMLRLVQGQTLDVLREKFYPHLAYAGGMAFGGAWLGPATATKYLQLTATPTP